ncbi:MAG: right-handed parallel beta-helix repeat-containing protein [Planctomycetota bacterium]|nr:right-handed parallel beta-helix repeat-containing protein [Planctomycetota bacterium]
MSSRAFRGAIVLALAVLAAAAASAEEPGVPLPRPLGPPVGPRGPIGAGAGAKQVNELVINKPGVYENYVVDGEFKGKNLVQIKADGVTLRNCTILRGAGNGVSVYAKNVVIECCEIHHMLSGSFKDQDDAHGITGCPGALLVRDCDIHHCSGDGIQFDPSRKHWGPLTVEHCRFWTGPLEADAAGFKKGERPGENGIDTKHPEKDPRAQLTIRNCVGFGFRGGQIDNMAAFNLKEHIDARIEGCIFYDNEIGLRLRGPGRNGGAKVSVFACAFFDSDMAARIENQPRDLKLRNLALGSGLKDGVKLVGKPGEGYEDAGSGPAPPLAQALRTWGARQ